MGVLDLPLCVPAARNRDQRDDITSLECPRGAWQPGQPRPWNRALSTLNHQCYYTLNLQCADDQRDDGTRLECPCGAWPAG